VTPVATCHRRAEGMASALGGDHIATPPPPVTEPLPEAVATTLPAASTIDTASEKPCVLDALFQISTLGIRALSAVGLPAASHEIGPVTFAPPA
jgi:hypothetical protein